MLRFSFIKGHRLLMALCALAALLYACAPRPVVSGGPKPTPPKPGGRPAYEKIDTIRWTSPSPGATPPIGENSRPPAGNEPNAQSGDTYKIAFLLPFLGGQYDAATGVLPERSRLALQFYAGAKIALEQLSKEEGLNLVADVLDTQASDADFQKLMGNSRLQKAQVLIGPIRSSHVALMAERIRSSRQILVSPETPNADLTAQNPGFIQMNPSLQAHCEALIRFVRKSYPAEQIVLVCKKKEADRLPYFHNANAAMGGGRMQELLMADEATGFDAIDFSRYYRSGRTAVFIAPMWANQDFVMSLLRKIRNTKGANRVEVYGMPQWKNFENIEPEYFTALNVHIPSGAYVDYHSDDFRAFQQRFYDQFGTIPDEDGINGYDVTLFVGKMLRRYGLSFPERLPAAGFYRSLHADFQFAKIFSSGAVDDASNTCDYIENKFIHILKFDKTGFVPAVN